MPVDITLEQAEEAVKVLRHLPWAAERAMSRAINRAISSARSLAIRRAVQRYNIERARLIAGMGRTMRATRKRLSATFGAASRRPTLYQFDPSPSEPGTGGVEKGTGAPGKPPLHIEVRRGRRRMVDGAFVFRGKSGNMLVGRRDPTQRMKSNPKKERVQGLYGPAIPQMLGRREGMAEVEEKARTMLDKRLKHEIDFELRRAAK